MEIETQMLLDIKNPSLFIEAIKKYPHLVQQHPALAKKLDSATKHRVIGKLQTFAKDKDWWGYYELLADWPELRGHPKLQDRQDMDEQMQQDLHNVDEMCGDYEM